MVVIPFIYLLFLLLLVITKKKKFDISAYLISIYLVSAFFSILIDVNGLRSLDTRYYDISIIPTIVYCVLLTIVIYPFIKLPPLKIRNINASTAKLFNTISYFYIIIFFILLTLSFDLIKNILSGDMNEIRRLISSGQGDDMSIFSNVSKSLKPVVVICNVFSSTSMVMLLFYFYSICFMKKSKLYNLLLLTSSTSILIFAIIGVDRSKVIYWALAYGFFLILFWDIMSKKQRRRNINIAIIFCTFALAYFLTLTFQRFEYTDSGAGGSIISYAGQSFINFCYFYEFHPYKGFTLQKVFPLFYKLFVSNDISNSVELNSIMTSETGVFHGIFNTFIGDIMMSSNSLIALLYCLTISFLASRFLKIKNKKIDFYFLIILFYFYSIVLFGLFVHFYAEFTRVICFILFTTYAYFNRNVKLKLKKTKTTELINYNYTPKS